MKASLKFILKLFLVTSIPIGIVFFFLIYDNLLWEAIISASIFGFMMSTFFGLIQIFKIKKAGYTELTDDLFKMHQKKSIDSTKTKNEILDLLKSHNSFSRSRIISVQNKLLINKSISLFSWGEKITITFLTNKDKIIIESKPAMSLTMVDYAINLINVDEIYRIINNA